MWRNRTGSNVNTSSRRSNRVRKYTRIPGVIGNIPKAPESVLCEHENHIASVNTNAGHSNIPESWILLDNQSTVDVFTNQRLLKNIRESKEPVNILSTAGTTKTNLIGDLPGYGTVWYLPGGIANI